MRLVGPKVHRALAFIAALNQVGYKPTAHEVDAFANDIETAFVSEIIDGVFSPELFERSSFGGRESAREYLSRVHWAVQTAEGLKVTECGRYVLLALDAEDPGGEGGIEVSLDPDDPAALSAVVKRLASLGKALLVDPYLRLEQLNLIAGYTEIDRVLITDAVEKPERSAMAHALSNTVINRPIEVRVAKKSEVHDRYVIPEVGPVTFIGSSIGTVGRRPTVIGQLRDTADEVRARYENVWRSASVLGAVPEESVSADGKAEKTGS